MLCLMVSCEVVGGPLPKAFSASTQVAPAHDRFHILKFDGALRNQRRQKRTDVTGVVGILFSIYAQQDDRAPLWQEVHTVEIAHTGSFTTFLGAETTGGIPLEVFSNEKARWLGNLVLLPGEVEAPRIRILSTPAGLTVAEASAPLPETADRPAPNPQTPSPNLQRQPRLHRQSSAPILRRPP
jgi:hypothetical protein